MFFFKSLLGLGQWNFSAPHPHVTCMSDKDEGGVFWFRAPKQNNSASVASLQSYNVSGIFSDNENSMLEPLISFCSTFNSYNFVLKWNYICEWAFWKCKKKKNKPKKTTDIKKLSSFCVFWNTLCPFLFPVICSQMWGVIHPTILFSPPNLLLLSELIHVELCI